MIKLSKRHAQIGVGIALAIFAFLIIAPLLIDGSSLKAQIERSVSQSLKADVKIKGKLETSFLPLPKIFLNDVTISNLIVDEQYTSDIKVKNISLRPGFFSIFGSKFTIAKLVLDEPQITNKYLSLEDQEKLKTNPPTYNQIGTSSDSALGGLFNFKESDTTNFDMANIKSIQVKEGSFVRHNIDNEVALEFKNINFLLKNNSPKFNVEGHFMSEDEPTSFVLKANTQADSSLLISSAILNLTLSGKFSNSNISNLAAANFIGKVDANIIDLKSFLGKYVAKNSPLYNKINSTRLIKITADIDAKAGDVMVNNIKIESELMKGTGKISANLKETKPKASIELDFNNIDIDSIWFSGAINSGSNTINIENEIIKNFLGIATITTPIDPNAPHDENKTYLLATPVKEENLPTPSLVKPLFDNLDLTAKIKVKTARYYASDLQNISLDFVTVENNLLLQPLSVDIPGGGTLKINGSLMSENDIPKFVGKLEISGKDLQKSLTWMGINFENLKAGALGEYTINSDLLMLPSFNILNNFNLSTNAGKNAVSGTIKIDDSAGIPNMTANLKVNYLDYDEYFVSDKQSTYLSSGSLLKKLLWLNSINSNRDISVSFDQLLYAGNSFANQGFKIKLSQGHLKLYDINFASEKFDLKGNIDVDITNNPVITHNIDSNQLQYQSTNSDGQKTKNLLDYFFNLPAMDEFSGNLSINIKNLAFNDWQAKNIAIGGEMKFGIIDFENFTLQAHKGDVIYKGSVILKELKTINGSLELTQVDAGGPLSDLLNIKNISGISNISAVVNSVAETKGEFFKNLDAQGQFIGKNIVVKGFGIYDMAVKMAQPKKYQSEVVNPSRILYNPDASSTLTDVSGAFAIKKGNPEQFSIKTSNSGINGVISGKFDVEDKTLDGSANFIFISGTRQVQVPINIATNFKGKSGELQRVNNFNQIGEYLKQRLGNGGASRAPQSQNPQSQNPVAPAPAN